METRENIASTGKPKKKELDLETRNRLAPKPDFKKEFTKEFQYFQYRYTPSLVWRDFVEMFAISIANTCELNGEIRAQREKTYAEILGRYTPEDFQRITKLAAITIQALTENPCQDFLGSLYMGLGLGNAANGQFFSPWNVSYAMGMMTLANAGDEVKAKEYISVSDPCCGAGGMLVAAAAAYHSSGKGNFQTDILFAGQDLDSIAAMMCYIQLSLLGCASLTNPVVGPDLLPAIGEGGELWYTPMFYSSVWMKRRIQAHRKLSKKMANAKA